MLFSKFFFFFFRRKSGNFGVLMSKKSGANVPQNILVLCALHSGYSAASIIIFLRCIAWLDFRCHSWLAAPPLGVGANYDHATLIKSMARQFIKKNIRGPKPLSGIMPCCYLSLSLLPTPLSSAMKKILTSNMPSLTWFHIKLACRHEYKSCRLLTISCRMVKNYVWFYNSLMLQV